MFSKRLLFVTGKGGVGKTVTTAALALAAFSERRRVLVIELTPHGSVRDLLGGPEPGAEPVEIQPRLELVRIDPREALAEFLQGLLRFRSLVNRLLESQSFSVLTAAAPGIEEFLVLSKIARFEALKTGLRRTPRYDTIVVDSPATGHSLPFLTTARTLLDMVPVGPIASLATEVDELISDEERTAAVLVTIPQEMAVNEAIEMAEGLKASKAIAVGAVVANGVWPKKFDDDEESLLRDRDGKHPLVAIGRYHLEKRAREQEQLGRLRRSLGRDPIELPFQFDETLERPAIRTIAAALTSGISGAHDRRAGRSSRSRAFGAKSA